MATIQPFRAVMTDPIAHRKTNTQPHNIFLYDPYDNDPVLYLGKKNGARLTT